MRLKWWGFMVFAISGGLLLSTQAVPAASLSPEIQKALDSSTYVYIQTERKNGDLGSPAEIWFMHHDGAVWVASPVATHRVKRIQAGQTKARVAVGKRDGPAFDAKGSIVKDPEVNEVLFETFAKKYSGGWSSFEKNFRDGLADGSRALIKYEPTE